MIQRIQSLWLLIAGLFAFATLKFSFYSGNKLASNNVKLFQPLNATSSIVLMILTVAVAVMALVLIFLYKDRKRQLLIAIAATIISIANIFIYFAETRKFVEGNYDLTALVSFFIPILLILAINGIYKDEKLVKSADRLR